MYLQAYRRLKACIGLSIFLFTVLLSCTDEPASTQPAAFATPSAAESSSNDERATRPAVEEPDFSAPRIDVDPEDSVISVTSINLDLETTEEQVLALRSSGVVDAPIRVVVVAFDKVWDTYRAVFESETTATNPRSFSLYYGDLVGDHNTEIVARGMNDTGEQTLTVYRKTISPTGYGLYYETICEIAVDGSIDIVEVDRGAGYTRGQANGRSYPIVTLAHDPESDNLLDLVKRSYYWRFEQNRYVEEAVEKIPGEVVREQRLAALYRAGTESFEEFLEGSWYLSESSGTPGDGPIVMHFDRDDDEFVYYAANVQESYNWVSTYKFLANRVVINGENEHVHFIRRQFYVQVDALDTIRILRPDSWQGTYRRMTDEMRLSLERSDQPDRRKASDVSLDGTYVGDTGNQITFDSPRFTLTEEGETLRGGYSLYDAGAVVLELKIFDNAGLVVDKRRYGLEYFEERRDDRIFRTILLVPGIVGVYGFEPTGEASTSIRFEQIQTLDE